MTIALPMAYIRRRSSPLMTRLTRTLIIVAGPRQVRRPRLIFRKSACVTIMFAGALVYCGCSRSSSAPRNRASSGTGSQERPAARPPGASGW